MKTALILLLALSVSASGQLPPSTVNRPAPPKAAPATAPTAPVTAAASPIVRHYHGKVLYVSSKGSLIRCTQWSEPKNPEGTAQGDVLGEFFLRGYPGELYDDADLRFYATQDGRATYPDIFGGTRTVRAIQFVKADKTSSGPDRVPVSSMQRIGGGGGAYIPIEPKVNPATPKLKGTTLDRKPE